MKKIGFATISLALVLTLLLPVSIHASTSPQITGLTSSLPRVMTYNLYQGTELVNVLTATTPTAFLVGAATDYAHQIANNFPERAQAIASEVASTQPDLIGLQEVALWRIGPFIGPSTPPPTNVAFDYLQILLDAISSHGVPYSALVVRNNFDVSGPACSTLPTCFPLIDLRLTDRSAILVKTADLSIHGLSFNNIQSKDYVTNTVLPPTVLGGPPIVLLGGWASVDVSIGSFEIARFVSTHLDGFSPVVNLAQAMELTTGPLATTIPEVLMTGDLNSIPGSSTYNAFIAAGFTDSWARLHPTDPGFTCCQVYNNGVVGAIVDVINNPSSNLVTRVDQVMIRGPVPPSTAVLVGADPSTRTASGLWPSDHAGLVVSIGIAGTND